MGKSLRPFYIYLGLTVLILISLNGCGTVSGSGPAQVEVENAWVRTSPKMAGTGAIYMTLRNSGGEADKLLSGETSAAKVVELHESFIDENEVMKMRPVEGGAIEIPAGGATELKPGGLHIMLIDLVEPLQSGTEIELTLNFEKRSQLNLSVPVLDGRPENN